MEELITDRKSLRNQQAGLPPQKANLVLIDMSRKVHPRRDSQQILGNSQQRVTTQRALLLDILRQGDSHVDADELYRRARQQYPRLSLSTVYRNLQLFKKLGLIEEHHFNEGHHHYEVKSLAEHQHLLCLGCGKVIEFACPLSQKFKEAIGRQHDFDIIGAEVRVTGLCPDCRQEKGT